MLRYVIFFLATTLLEALNAIAQPKPPVVYDVTHLLADPSQRFALRDGSSIRLNTAPLPKGRLEFVDLFPQANWGHPAELRVVTPQGKVIETRLVDQPPEGLVLGEPRPIEFKIHTAQGKLKVNNPSRYHALLFNGDSNLRHWNDFAFLYRVLTQVYGYLPSQIYVADSNNKDERSDLDGDGKPDIRFESTRGGLEALVRLLKDTVKSSDQLLVVINDHGKFKEGVSTILLQDGQMTSQEFASLMKQLPAGSMLSIFEQCYGGGFVRPTVAENRVSLAASTNHELSWATDDLQFDEFLYHLTAAFATQTHEGNKVLSDSNQDGLVSAHEAFTYALKSSTTPASPFLESDINSGDATRLGLGTRLEESPDNGTLQNRRIPSSSSVRQRPL